MILYICSVGTNPTYEIIKRTVLSYLPDARVLLFGSRARGTDDKHSDYDLLVITPKHLSRNEKLNWSNEVDKALIKAIHAPVDILFYSEQEIKDKQVLPGHIVRTAIKEGVTL